jgi:hypothetical protein
MVVSPKLLNLRKKKTLPKNKLLRTAIKIKKNQMNSNLMNKTALRNNSINKSLQELLTNILKQMINMSLGKAITIFRGMILNLDVIRC